MKKMVIAGGTGFLGQILAEYYKNKYETIFILSRRKKDSNGNINYVQWDGKSKGSWFSHLENADVLINLTGKSVDCRYNEKNKTAILNSRVDATEILGHAIRICDNPPKVWLNSSTATIYRHSMDKEMDEETGEIGTGFSVSVATSWEESFFSQITPKTRKVALRTAIVLGKKGGSLKPIVNLVKAGLGGKQGSGDQYFSWLHEDDFANAIEYIISNKHLDGVFNLVAPKPATNKQLMGRIRYLLKIPFGMPLPKWLLEIGAIMIRTETELVLKSRRVIPKRLMDEGYSFKYGDLTKCMNHLLLNKKK
ncbi:TIGR01777 family oxidoreductase [Spongiivirga citrea]|uniref:TIGR01777 family protein n=1 Tax=Spongiivirga citrea TaxID=1481457 RepID=A0A6M0CEI9_9FLAO|nr:TIGR01777 family oxidoreductase [Spongiivirga citrea]NER16235.1 TIGR01777 family protein [Spongiivirga citrea]